MGKILVTRSSMPPIDEYIDEIKDLWDTHWLTNMGPKHDEFRNMLKEYLGVRYVDLLVNGHMALELSLQAMNLQGEVITTPFTFASTTHAIVRNGLIPIFCDVDPMTYTIDVNKIEALITERTCAILPVHVYGNICNVEQIDEIAKKYGLKVIYDAAHAFGEIYKGGGIGSFGDASIFSFHATKVFHSIEGGAVCFKSRDMGRILWDLKNFGIHSEEEVAAVGANAKMNEFCAAMGICNLRHIREEIQKRKQVVRRYDERLSGVEGIKLNRIPKNVTSNYAYYPVIFENYKYTRDEVYSLLRQNNIFARKYFYPLTNSLDCYRNYPTAGVDKTPVAHGLAQRVLTLPLYADLPLADVDRVCDIILDLRN